jgi:hypothetical protein
MAVIWKNRREDIYYLHEGRTKTGKPKYYFARSDKGMIVDNIPDGYEIYENPNAQVFLRKKLVSLIKDEELDLVERGVRQYADLKNFIVDRKERTMTVFLPDQDLEDLKAELQRFAFVSTEKLNDVFEKSLTYSPMLRFSLESEDQREFLVQRYCFLGSIDDWIYLESSSSLKDMVKKYCTHLGKESFFDLM